tara:strand:+ start:22 stop:336 length:315 start_codon:yes stop_codon:yes gene_type:complete
MEEIIINVAKDFSEYCSGREGEFGGEEFRKTHLVPHLKDKKKVIILLDGTMGYTSAFLEEAFGGLVREEGFNNKELQMNLELESKDIDLKDDIEEYIDRAELFI